MIDPKVLVRYVTGECTPDERRTVKRWMQDDPARRAELRHLERIWDAAGSAHAWDVDAAWQRFVHENVNRDEQPARRRGRKDRRSAPSVRRRRPRTAWASLVVVIVLITAVGYLWQSQITSLPDRPAFEHVATQPGERARVTLSDGTTIQLGVASTLRYPARFGDEQRSVSLEGEAYFEVARDTARPFVITANGTTTRVLGTAFSVTAYPNEPGVRVAVREGRVAIAHSRGTSGRVVSAGQVGRVDSTGRIALTTPGDLHAELGWLDGRLVFEDESFDVVLRRLERWYAVDGHLADPALADLRLTATLANEPLPNALDAIAMALNVRYEMDQHRSVVTFYPR